MFGAIVLLLVLAGVAVGVILYLRSKKHPASLVPGSKGGRKHPRGFTPSAPSATPAQKAAHNAAVAAQMAQYAAASGGGGNVGAAAAKMGGSSAISDALYKGAPYGASASAGVPPMAVAGTGHFATLGNLTSPFGDQYPNNDVGLTEASNDPWSGSNMQIDKLMPSSWRSAANQSCGDASRDDSEWAKWSPTRQKFENFVTASGASRMALSTRDRNPTGGIRNLLRSSPPVGLSGQSITFNDSDARMNIIFNATGIYPSTTTC